MVEQEENDGDSSIHDHKKSVEAEHRRLSLDEPAVRNGLERIVSRLEENFHARQDLLQEAWIHFWSRKRQYPRQRLGWYLRGVSFHLKDLKNSGRSVDSLKRRRAQRSFPDRCDEWDHWRDSLEFDEGFLSAVTCRDMLSVLVPQLKETDKRILGELADGLGVCEIAAKLKLSHGFVAQRRQDGNAWGQVSGFWA